MTAKTSIDVTRRNIPAEIFFKLALALVGVEWQRVSLYWTPLGCHDPDEKPYRHSHINGVSWRIVGSGGNVERHGRISRKGRVTEFKAGQQVALPFGENWNGESETEYQFARWKAWDSHG